MNENKTIGMLLLIIVILVLALGIKIFFFKDSSITEFTMDQNGVVVKNTTRAEDAIANKTSDYVDSVQQEKDNHKELENEWDSYSN